MLFYDLRTDHVLPTEFNVANMAIGHFGVKRYIRVAVITCLFLTFVSATMGY